MPAPLTTSSKSTRWYKKQLLARSDAEVKARMKREGHSFKNRLAAIDAVMRQASITLHSDRSEAQVREVSGSSEALKVLGFRSLGQGIMKLGHSIWKMGTDEDGGIVCQRLQAETVECEKFPRRKQAYSDSDLKLRAMGWPQGALDAMDRNTKIGLIIKQGHFKCPDEVISIRGLPAKILGHDDYHFRVAFQGSGIVDHQPIAKVLDLDANSLEAAIEEQVKACIASGELTKQAQESVEHDLLAGTQLSVEEVNDFVAHMAAALDQALMERLTARTAQSIMHWSDFNGIQVCDFSEVLHGCVAEVIAPIAGFAWSLYSAGKLIEQGMAGSPEEACADCASAAGVVTPESWVGKRVLNDQMLVPEFGVVTEEIRDDMGNVSHLNVKYESDKIGRLDLNHWHWDEDHQAVVSRLVGVEPQ